WDAPCPPLGDLRWMLRAAAGALPEVPFPGFRADLLAELAAALERLPATAATLAATAGRHPAASVPEHLTALVAAGLAVPAIGDPPASALELPRLSPFNRAALARSIGADDARVLAAPAIGGGVAVDR